MTKAPAQTVGTALAGPDRLLVLSALGNRETARTAWGEWASAADLDDVPPSAFVGLPAVSRNLDRLGIEHQGGAILRGIYRYAWTRAQLTLRDLVDVTGALTRAGVKYVVSHGVPTVLRSLGDVAGEVVDQSSVVIDQDELSGVTDILEGSGWRTPRALPPARIRSAYAWLPFENPDRGRIVVRWRVHGPQSPRDCDRGLLARAEAEAIQGAEILVPDRTDQLLLLCAETLALRPGQHLRWGLEICGLLREPDHIDVEAFAERASRAAVIHECAAALDAIRPLADSLPEVQVPILAGGDGSLSRAGVGCARPPDKRDRLDSAIRGARERYRAACARDSRTRTPWDFVRFTSAFYEYEWGVGGIGGLGIAGVRHWRQGHRDVEVAEAQ